MKNNPKSTCAGNERKSWSWKQAGTGACRLAGIIHLLLGALLSSSTGSTLSVSGTDSTPWPHDPCYGVSKDIQEQSLLPEIPQPVPEWIVAPPTPGAKEAVIRHRFDLPSAAVCATAYTLCDTATAVYVNGKQTHPPRLVQKWRVTLPAEIGPSLRVGENVITFIYKPSFVPMVALLDIILADGSHKRIVTDPAWKAALDPAADVKEASMQPGFDDSGWKPVASKGMIDTIKPWEKIRYWPETIVNPTKAYLRQAQVFPLSAMRTQGGKSEPLVSPAKGPLPLGEVSPQLWKECPALLEGTDEQALKSLSEHAPGFWVDFGREMNGRLHLQSDSKVPCVAFVALGESPAEALFKPFAAMQKLFLEPGGECRALETGFRYARIFLVPVTPAGSAAVPLSLKRVWCDFIFYPVAYRGDFRCSDPVLEKIWQMGAYTVHLNMQKEIWDGNKRDRYPFAGDATPKLPVVFGVFGDTMLQRLSLEHLKNICYDEKNDKFSNHTSGISTYSPFWIDNVYVDYLYTGDLDYIRSQSAYLTKLMRYMEQDLDAEGRFENLLKTWAFIDWSPNLWQMPPTPASQDQKDAGQMLFYLAVREMRDLMRALGDEKSLAEAKRCDALLERVGAVARKYIWDPKLGAFGPRKQVNALAIYSGLATAEEQALIEKNVLSQPFKDSVPGALGNAKLSAKDNMTPFMHWFVLNARSAAGNKQECFDFVREYWKKMMDAGDTTTPENFNSEFQPTVKLPYDLGWNWRPPGDFSTQSLCHGWSIGGTPWLSQWVVGFQILEPGCSRVAVRPFLGSLSWASGSMVTPRGVLAAWHEQSANEFRTVLDVPPGTVVEAGMPRTAGASAPVLRVDGKKVSPTRQDGQYWYVLFEKAGPHEIRAPRSLSEPKQPQESK